MDSTIVADNTEQSFLPCLECKEMTPCGYHATRVVCGSCHRIRRNRARRKYYAQNKIVSIPPAEKEYEFEFERVMDAMPCFKAVGKPTIEDYPELKRIIRR